MAKNAIMVAGVCAMPSAEEVARGLKSSSNGKGGKRGSVNNASRLAVFGKREAVNEGDWGGCDPTLMAGVVVAITKLGGAVTFSLSRDKGAHGSTLLLDDERQTLWYNGDADLEAELEAVMATLATLE